MKNIKKISRTVSLAVSSFSVFIFSLTLAPTAKAFSFMDGMSSGCRPNGSCELRDFVMLLINTSKFILGLSGSVALLFFVYGGVTFLVSGGSQEKVTKGKQTLIGAAIGMIIIFTSYTIINFIISSLGVAEPSFTTPTQ